MFSNLLYVSKTTTRKTVGISCRRDELPAVFNDRGYIRDIVIALQGCDDLLESVDFAVYLIQLITKEVVAAAYGQHYYC